MKDKENKYSTMQERLVIIPTYNERENIAKMIDSIISLYDDIDVLIVDDNSPDATAEIVKDKQELYASRLFLIERNGKQGLGTAYIRGFRWALERGYKYICEMDCDFSHPLSVLPTLFDSCASGIGVSIGSRYIKGGVVENWPKTRIFISKGASLYVKLITGIPVNDTTSGFVCYRSEVLQSINLDSIHFKGYGFQIEMKYVAYHLGYILKEIPITFTNRVLGQSKMSSAIFGEAFWGVMKLRYWRMKGELSALHKKRK